MQPPKPVLTMDYNAVAQTYTETTDATLKKVFDDNDECDPDIYEDRTVEGWSFV